ncbi:MAG: glycosyltransferase [Oscillospiraceae bacterium]|jgi:glycosyltransferase involved in cell wall biosynthesis|nr:glycosyltransferase [Oscillospiraceae bacterium]
MSKIVCLSTANWHPIPTRKQQVMGRLTGHRVLYFEPPVSRAAPLKDPAAAERLRAWRGEGEHITGSRVTVYATPPVWPLYNKYRLINRINQRAQARYLRRVFKTHGFENPLLWCYSPAAADVVDLLPHRALVYDCVDRHSAYGGLMTPAVVDAMEADLAAKADVVFATARGLCERLKEYNKNTYLIPNGANFELFHRAASERELPFPDELLRVKGPILGFVGMIQPCIDCALLLAVARARPGWSFVLVGAPLPGVDVAPLKAQQNIHFLGLKPHKELPRYLARFDVCLNLFQTGALAQDVSPLKFYEYLATGRPIVSTPQPDQVRDFSDAVYIADGPEAFTAACEKALAERGAWKPQQRISYGRAASWDARVKQMTEILERHGVL